MAPQISHGNRIFGAALMAIGGLIAGLCGACTFVSWYMLSGIAGGIGGPDLRTHISSAAIPLLVGGIPTVVGALIFRVGLQRYRGGRKLDRRLPTIFD